jgi:hypothetical protein
VGDFFGLAKPAHGDVVQHLNALLLSELLHDHGGFHVGRRDAVDGDAVSCLEGAKERRKRDGWSKRNGSFFVQKHLHPVNDGYLETATMRPGHPPSTLGRSCY